MARRFPIGGSFGVMQGRLSRQTSRGYQVFPWETWKEEFTQAADLGLEHIEWVLDSWRVDQNPIIKDVGSVKEIVKYSGVQVISVCADYLMDTPLDIGDSRTWNTLQGLVGAMETLDATHLVVPCVDQGSLRNVKSLRRFQEAAQPLSRLLADSNVRVSLECDLDPGSLTELLGTLDPNWFSVNYDIGNSAYLGYSLDEEFDAYGSRISVVHVKDRVFKQGSVFLGEGDADIPRALEQLRARHFSGPITVQAYRDLEGTKVLHRQLAWLQEQLEIMA